MAAACAILVATVPRTVGARSVLERVAICCEGDENPYATTQEDAVTEAMGRFVIHGLFGRD